METANPVFYGIDINPVRKNRFCYATNIRTIDNERVTKICQVCGTPVRLAAKRLIIDVDGGSQYPDFMYCAFGILIVSKNVLDVWEKAAASGYQCFPVQIDKVLSRKLRDNEPKEYFYVDVLGFCDWDRKKSDIRIISICKACGVIKYEPKWQNRPSGFILDTKTWIGADVFRSSIFNISFCTEKIVRCALENHFTGADFYLTDFVMAEERKFIKKVSDLVV